MKPAKYSHKELIRSLRQECSFRQLCHFRQLFFFTYGRSMACFCEALIDFVEKVQWQKWQSWQIWQYSMDAAHFFPRVNQK